VIVKDIWDEHLVIICSFYVKTAWTCDRQFFSVYCSSPFGYRWPLDLYSSPKVAVLEPSLGSSYWLFNWRVLVAIM